MAVSNKPWYFQNYGDVIWIEKNTKMARLLNINCWQATKIMLFLNKVCTKTQIIITLYGYLFYFVLTFDKKSIA